MEKRFAVSSFLVQWTAITAFINSIIFSTINYIYVSWLGIYFKITGHGKCRWSTLKRTESTAAPTNYSTDEATKDKDRFLHMSGEEDYLSGEIVYIAGSKHGKFLLLSHRHYNNKSRFFMSHFWSFRTYIQVITRIVSNL